MSTNAKQKITDTIAGGCSPEEFAALRCPACGSVLLLNVHHRKRSFYVRCAAVSLHFGGHGELKADPFPIWMNEKITGGWLD